LGLEGFGAGGEGLEHVGFLVGAGHDGYWGVII